jgi:hypothetical protein
MFYVTCLVLSFVALLLRKAVSTPNFEGNKFAPAAWKFIAIFFLPKKYEKVLFPLKS